MIINKIDCIIESQPGCGFFFKGVYMQNKINNLLNFCYNNTDSIEFQLFLITVKCLIPHEDSIGCGFDTDRYKKEIELFEHYMNGSNEIIDFRLKNKKPSHAEDDLLEFKIIPIVLSNTVYENLINEVLKAALFYTLNKKTILNTLLISSAIYEFMKNSDVEIIKGASKERLINFSIKEIFAKNQIDLGKEYLIDFEKERIKMIAKTILFEDTINKYRVLNYIFEEKTSADNGLFFASKESGTCTENNTGILSSFSIYLNKLRKGLINPEKLMIADKIPDIVECLKYPAFNHPLLGRCKVVKRTENETIVRNKSGLMRIRI